MTVFNQAIDTLFTDANMAVDGDYTKNDGEVISVRVVMSREEEGAGLFSTGAVIGSLVAEIRTSELQGAAEGDVLTIGDDSYTVASVERRDSGRYIWSLSLTEV